MARKMMRTLILLVLAVGLLTAKSSSASFKECYTKCFIFCVIDPSQTLCSCTTRCLKDCIFQQIQNDVRRDSDDSLGFCKLGCAFSMCSAFSTKRTPNGEKVDGCVGSCSNKCTKRYPSP